MKVTTATVSRPVGVNSCASAALLLVTAHPGNAAVLAGDAEGATSALDGLTSVR